MEAYEKLNEIKELIGASNIVDELIQYMSSDDLEDFVEHLASAYDIDFENED